MLISEVLIWQHFWFCLLPCSGVTWGWSKEGSVCLLDACIGIYGCAETANKSDRCARDEGYGAHILYYWSVQLVSLLCNYLHDSVLKRECKALLHLFWACSRAGLMWAGKSLKSNGENVEWDFLKSTWSGDQELEDQGNRFLFRKDLSAKSEVLCRYIYDEKRVLYPKRRKYAFKVEESSS